MTVKRAMILLLAVVAIVFLVVYAPLSQWIIDAIRWMQANPGVAELVFVFSAIANPHSLQSDNPYLFPLTNTFVDVFRLHASIRRVAGDISHPAMMRSAPGWPIG